MSKHQGAQSARSSHQLETRSTQTRSAGSEISSAFCEGVFLRDLTVTAVCILKKTNAWLSRVELFCCNYTLCKCDVASASANRVKHVSYLWMQFAEASFKNWGLFWSVFCLLSGVLHSPLRSRGAEQIVSLHFSAEKLGHMLSSLLRILQVSRNGIFPLVPNLSCSKHPSSSPVLQGTAALLALVPAIHPFL